MESLPQHDPFKDPDMSLWPGIVKRLATDDEIIMGNNLLDANAHVEKARRIGQIISKDDAKWAKAGIPLTTETGVYPLHIFSSIRCIYHMHRAEKLYGQADAIKSKLEKEKTNGR